MKKNKEHQKRYDIIVLSGGFDPIHSGHISMIQTAAKLAKHKVIVGVNSDEWLRRKKGYNLMPYTERAYIVESLFDDSNRYAPVEAHSFDDSDDTAISLIDDITFKKGHMTVAFGNGGDRTDKTTPEIEHCRQYGVGLLWGLGGGKTASSSDFFKNAIQQLGLNPADESEIEYLDGVNHPNHYNQGSTEVIDIINEQGHLNGFCYGNALKYLMRAPHKGDEIRDLQKAVWYIKKIMRNKE